MRILVFGDSIAQGYYDLTAGGWAQMLFVDNLKRKARNKHETSEIFNVAISGDTLQSVIERLESEINARQWADEPITLIFAVGINDSRLENDEPLMAPETFQEQLEKLYVLAKTLAKEIVFVGLSAVDESESAPWIFNSGTNKLIWLNKRIQSFDAILKQFAVEQQITFIPVFDEFLRRLQQGEELVADGLHPNHEGHVFIYEQVRKSIEVYQSPLGS